jgi:hypothetical protein
MGLSTLVHIKKYLGPYQHPLFLDIAVMFLRFSRPDDSATIRQNLPSLAARCLFKIPQFDMARKKKTKTSDETFSLSEGSTPPRAADRRKSSVPSADSTSFSSVSSRTRDVLQVRDGYSCWVCEEVECASLDVAHLMPRSDKQTVVIPFHIYFSFVF